MTDSMALLRQLPDFDVGVADLVATAQLLLTRKIQLERMVERKNFEVTGLREHGLVTYDDAERALKRIKAVAGALLKQALGMVPDEPTALKLLATLYREKSEYVAALACERAALTQSPDDRELRAGEIKSLLALARFDEAVDIVSVTKNMPRVDLEHLQIMSFQAWCEAAGGRNAIINEAEPFVYPFTAIIGGNTISVDHVVNQTPLLVTRAQDVSVIDGFVPRKGLSAYVFELGRDVLSGRSEAIWNNAYIRRKNQETQVVETPCIYLTGVEWHYQNYYHALAQNFSRLALLMDHLEFARHAVAVPERIRPWGIEFLTEMGVSADRLIFLPNGVDSLLLNAVVPEVRRVPSRDEIQAMRRRLGVHTQQRGTRRFFIGRKSLPSHGRLLVNEVEIAAVAREYGFEEVEPGGMTIRQQIELFAQAEAVCGPNGAAFTNILYAPEKAAVICMSPQETTGTWYPDLAAQCDQRYFWCLGKFLPEGANSRLVPKVPYFIDPDDFNKMLQMAFAV